MEYAPLLGTTYLVSRVGFGCAAMGGYDYGPVDDADSIRAVHRALELGINLFDVADVYGFGHAERILGRALGVRASEVVVATKVGVRWDEAGRTRRDLSPHWVAAAVDGCLRRLGVSHIPLCQMHWPDPATPIEATLSALARCIEQGKLGAVGCCNFSLEQLSEARRLLPIVSLQVSHNVADRANERAMREAMTTMGVSVLTYNSLGQGLLTGRYGERSKFAGTDHRSRSAYFAAARRTEILGYVTRAREVAASRGKTVSQVALRWSLDSGAVTAALTGIKNASQAEENAGALGWCLTPRERAYLLGAGDAASR